MIGKAAVVGVFGLVFLTPVAALGQFPPPIPNGTSQGVGIGAAGRMTDRQESRRF